MFFNLSHDLTSINKIFTGAWTDIKNHKEAKAKAIYKCVKKNKTKEK